MKVLLLGGTGAIGVHLSNILSQRGIQVWCTSRQKRSNYENVSFVKGNAKELSFLKYMLKYRNWDSIIDFMCYSTNEFEERIELLLSNTKQYVFLSSARVYAATENLLDENSPRLLDVCTDKSYLKTDEYALYKAREENILFRSKLNNYTIVRPYITYGENRIPLGVWEKESWLKRALQGKNIAMPRKFLYKTTTLAYGRDVSDFIAEVVGNPNARGQIYNIVSHEEQTWKEISDIYLDEINKINHTNVKIVEFGECCSSIRSMFKCALIKFGIMKSQYGCYSWKHYQLIYDREFNRRFDNTKTIQLAPHFKFGCNDNHMRKCLQSFIKKPEYHHPTFMWDIIQDKITGEYTPLSYFPCLKWKAAYILVRYLIPRLFIYSK